MVAASRPCSPNSARAASRMRCAVAARLAAPLPTSDPQAAATELERCVTQLGHVGAMIHGRTDGHPHPGRPRLRRPVRHRGQLAPADLHPLADPLERAARCRGLDPLVDLGLATFGWGWHMEAGLSALRLILRGTFDRHPDLQLVLGHWGEMLLFWMDRADSLSGIAKQLERRVSDYIKTNIHITSSGMLQERLLCHTLDFQRRPGAVLRRLPLPPAQRSRGQAVLRRHPRSRGPLQGRLRQRRGPVSPDLTGPAPATRHPASPSAG